MWTFGPNGPILGGPLFPSPTLNHTMTHSIVLLAAAALVGGAPTLPRPSVPPVVVVHAKEYSYVAP